MQRQTGSSLYANSAAYYRTPHKVSSMKIP